MAQRAHLAIEIVFVKHYEVIFNLLCLFVGELAGFCFDLIRLSFLLRQVSACLSNDLLLLIFLRRLLLLLLYRVLVQSLHLSGVPVLEDFKERTWMVDTLT